MPSGGNLTCTLMAVNKGPSTATDVTLTDLLSGVVSLVRSSSSQGNCSEAAGIVTCTVGTLASGDNATVIIIVNAKTVGTITNTATLTSKGQNPNPGGNIAFQTTTVNPAANLRIIKEDFRDPILDGESPTDTLFVTNIGPSDAPEITLTDTEPEEMSFVSVSVDCAEAGGLVACNHSHPAPGDNTTVTIVATPNSTGNLINTASVTSSVADSNPGDNTTIVSTTVRPAADLRLTKTESADPVPLGDNLTYTLIVTNGGPSDATG